MSLQIEGGIDDSRTDVTLFLFKFIGIFFSVRECHRLRISIKTSWPLRMLTQSAVVQTRYLVLVTQILKRLEATMKEQIKHEYNKTALPSNVTNATTLQVTSFWDTMQIQVI
jgi:hypothetical protein